MEIFRYLEGRVTYSDLLIRAWFIFIGVTGVSSAFSCTGTKTNDVELCYWPSLDCCSVELGRSRCCRLTSCYDGGFSRACCSSISHCCPVTPAATYVSTCCDNLKYTSYLSSSSSSYWSSVSKSSQSRADAERAVGLEIGGTIAGSVIGVIIFIVLAVGIPVAVAKNAAAKRYRANAPTRTQDGQPYVPRVAGTTSNPSGQTQAPAPVVTFQHDQPYTSHPGEQYPPSVNPAYASGTGNVHDLQQPMSVNPSWQSAPTAPSSTDDTAPPPSYAAAMEMVSPSAQAGPQDHTPENGYSKL